MNNKLNIKVAFFDIDGTLINSNRKLTNNTIKTLNKLHNIGIKIVLCSGRPNSYICNFSNIVDGIRYIISSNGAEIYDCLTKENIYSSRIDYNFIKNIWEYCIKNKISIILNSINERYANKYNNKYNNNYKKDLIILDNINSLENIDIYQLVINFDTYEQMVILQQFIANNSNLKIINCSFDYLSKKVYGYHWFDIVNNNVNKGNAIEQLLNYLGIDKSNAICFGDSINDIDMFDVCGIRVAMGNALDELKEKADYITDTNDNDGISKFFNNFIL